MVVVMIQQHRGRILFVVKVVNVVCLMCKIPLGMGKEVKFPSTYLRYKKHHHPRKE